MFWDKVNITVKAGNGGNGLVSFRHEYRVAKGGPDGGDGGKGGDITFKVNDNLNTLSYFNSRKRFKAKDGGNGRKGKRHGANGEDLILEVPKGTLVIDNKTNEVLADLSSKGEQQVIAKGGRGGFGNAHFSSAKRQTPRFAEKGEPGKFSELQLELRLVADVGIIGLPSVGKSTLISRISNAHPKIADYPFTTLIPNLGVVVMEEDRFIVCDIPGLIKGAHKGKGLGDDFLRHIERTNVLIHLIDVNDADVTKSYQQIYHELELYDKTLMEKPQLVVLNKIDTIDSKTVEKLKSDLRKKVSGLRGKLFAISAVSGVGIDKLLYATSSLLAKERFKLKKEEPKYQKDEYKVFRPHLKQEAKAYEIQKIKSGKYQISGERIEQIVVMSDLQNLEALERLYDVLIKMGIQRALTREGAKEGDTLIVGEEEIVFRES